MGTYRFYAQLQKNTDNLATSDKPFSQPPTYSEAVAVVEGLKSKGKSELPRKAHEDFESTVDKVVTWLGNNRGTSYGGNGDIRAARREFKYSGETYRVDIGIGGETANSKWFV
ncbi:hypothetical protein Osc7112_2709 [Oscillatoria nigro-viridis PCC 7112]|uniref:Uncharacterized protein n=1 Tax=Phormidium nigroviride PCC 7112 TaxID=179408 RepID=K9VI08_9CYAN|nr:hypothetical protein [Oscillatoria nigro-viridis]AFZ07122.1 hypothetical protein Osc7112_2709 [Oscillatoria nigro-viridis PCC 7112]